MKEKTILLSGMSREVNIVQSTNAP